MPTVLLDGDSLSMDGTPATWADLLVLVDKRLDANGLIVTGVRFDGVDEAAFREPLALDQSLADLATVEVTTGTPASLMEQCVSEAVSSIEPLCAAATATGERFRRFELEPANQALVELAEGMSMLIAIGGALTLAVKGVSGDDGRQRAALNDSVVQLTGYFDSLLSAQQAQDWITLADVLQYDVEPSLRRWENVLTQLKHTATA